MSGLEKARRSPLRARILELYEADESRSLEPRDLLDAFQGEFGDPAPALIQYHVRRLRQAGLISDPGGQLRFAGGLVFAARSEVEPGTGEHRTPQGAPDRLCR